MSRVTRDELLGLMERCRTALVKEQDAHAQTKAALAAEKTAHRESIQAWMTKADQNAREAAHWMDVALRWKAKAQGEAVPEAITARQTCATCSKRMNDPCVSFDPERRYDSLRTCAEWRDMREEADLVQAAPEGE